MSDPIKRAIRRHIREKSIIGQTAKDVKPQPASEAQQQKAKTNDGHAIEDQVRKKWDPKKGGLPTFWRRAS